MLASGKNGRALVSSTKTAFAPAGLRPGTPVIWIEPGMGPPITGAAPVGFAAYCLNSAAAFPIASASARGLDLANPRLFGGELVDGSAVAVVEVCGI